MFRERVSVAAAVPRCGDNGGGRVADLHRHAVAAGESVAGPLRPASRCRTNAATNPASLLRGLPPKRTIRRVQLPFLGLFLG